jgi:flagellar basal body rod protein FlgC
MADGASTPTFKWNLNGSGSTPTVTQLPSPQQYLIVAQRAFETNSKTMTTFDTISQDVLAIVR